MEESIKWLKLGMRRTTIFLIKGRKEQSTPRKMALSNSIYNNKYQKGAFVLLMTCEVMRLRTAFGTHMLWSLHFLLYIFIYICIRTWMCISNLISYFPFQLSYYLAFLFYFSYFQHFLNIYKYTQISQKSTIN